MPLPPYEDTRTRHWLWTRKKVLTRPPPCWCLTVDFQPPELRNTFLLFLSQLVWSLPGLLQATWENMGPSGCVPFVQKKCWLREISGEMFSSVTLCSLRSPFVVWSSCISSQRVRPCAMLSTWHTCPILSFHNRTHVAISYASVLGPHQNVSILLKSEEKINITLPLLYSIFSNGIIKCSFRFVLFCF